MPSPTPADATTGDAGAAPAAPAPVAAPPDATAAAPTVGHGGTPLSPVALSQRIERERRKWLRDEYGTDDPKRIAEIKAQRQAQTDEQRAREEEYKRLKAEEEKRAREAMTEQQRLQADLERERREKEELRARINELTTTQIANEQRAVITGIADKHVKPSMHKYALTEFASYVHGLKPTEVKRLTEKDIDRWFARFVKEQPDFAKPAAPAGAAPDQPAAVIDPKPAAPPPRRVVLRTSAKPIGSRPGTDGKRGAPVAPSSNGGKTPKPGQPNSMSKAELREYMQARGIRGW